ncbi:MAG: universal stress protein [Alphaproteobacteria bacterium]|nr:universal stress protein [Alphaproteobacteria bacterium]
MKSILLPVEHHASADSAITVAWQAARLFGSRVSAIALRPVHYQVVGAEPIVAVTFPPSEQEDTEALAGARGRFEAFVRANGADETGGAKLDWASTSPIDDNQIASISRVYDLTVVGRPATSGDGPRMTTLEAALFDGGRPILVAPPRPKATFGTNVVISWNQSTESARTVAFGIQLLKKAGQVSVLTIEGVTVPGPDGQALCDYLNHHGIDAAELTVPAHGRKPGIAILEEADKLGCDLLFKGAYTQSRIRQMILGGATSQILASANVPVFMAN